MLIQRATDGTPFASTIQSMYGPGGAQLAFGGAAIWRPPGTTVKPSGTNRLFSSKLWVTAAGGDERDGRDLGPRRASPIVNAVP